MEDAGRHKGKAKDKHTHRQTETYISSETGTYRGTMGGIDRVNDRDIIDRQVDTTIDTN